MSTLRQLAAALGGDVVGAAVLCPGPGHSPRDRSLSVQFEAMAPDGFMVFSHASDDFRTCRDHVAARLGVGRPPPPTLQRWRQAPAPADHTARALALWNSALAPRGTPVERYLERRALALSDDIAGSVARFHEACPWRAGDGTIEYRPAMLTAFRSITSDLLVAVQRTLLTEDGGKLGRRMLGPVAGAAIKIDADADVEQGLHIGEGFETALAARALGYRPVWALGSAGAIAQFSVLRGIDALTILAERDDGGANARAARTCGNRWVAAGRDILIATPKVDGDMNDAWQS